MWVKKFKVVGIEKTHKGLEFISVDAITFQKLTRFVIKLLILSDLAVKPPTSGGGYKATA